MRPLTLTALLAAPLALLAMLRKRARPPPPAPHVDAGPDPVARAAVGELYTWHGIDETDPEAVEPLTRYWTAAGLEPGSAIKDRTHWSAAFVSWVANAGAPGSLDGSPAHVHYVRSAYGEAAPGRYRAYKPDERRIGPGDIIVKWRGDRPITWSDVTDGSGFLPAHGDVVIDVSGDRARVVGGNTTGDTVGMRGIELADGFVTNPRAFAVLSRNRLDVA